MCRVRVRPCSQALNDATAPLRCALCQRFRSAQSSVFVQGVSLELEKQEVRVYHIDGVCVGAVASSGDPRTGTAKIAEVHEMKVVSCARLNRLGARVRRKLTGLFVSRYLSSMFRWVALRHNMEMTYVDFRPTCQLARVRSWLTVCALCVRSCIRASMSCERWIPSKDFATTSSTHWRRGLGSCRTAPRFEWTWPSS